MDKELKKLSEKSDKNFQYYLDTAPIATLHNLKLYSDDIYYNTGESSGLSDYQYDMLKETIERRDPGYVPPVGVKIRQSENRVELPFYMGSMDKFKPDNLREIARWILENQSPEYIVEDKLDGVSCLAVFENGKTKLYTRGDGQVGADISYLNQYFKTIPNKVKDKKVAGFFEKKSKIVETITKEDFPRYKDKKEIKRLVRDYDFFIASAKLMPAVATSFGRVLGPAGKMPSPQLGILASEEEALIKPILAKINNFCSKSL